ISWLTAFAGSLLMVAKVREANRADRKRKFMRWERVVTNSGGYIGAAGIFISGSAMASLSSGLQWGWFNFRLYPWLGVKQVIFFLILLLIFFSIKRSRAFRKVLEQQEGISQVISKRWSAAYRMSLMVYLMVFI